MALSRFFKFILKALFSKFCSLSVLMFYDTFFDYRNFKKWWVGG